MHTEKDMLMNIEYHKTSHLKFTFLNYLLKAIKLINKCSENNLLDVFKIYENDKINGNKIFQDFKTNKEFSSIIIDCFYNYTLYYFIKNNSENSKSVAELICDFSNTFDTLSVKQDTKIMSLVTKGKKLTNIEYNRYNRIYYLFMRLISSSFVLLLLKLKIWICKSLGSLLKIAFKYFRAL